jgi:hypothetical protein
MLNKKSVVACTLLVPFLCTAIPAAAQTQTQTQGQAVNRNTADSAKRAKCFEEANAAAAQVNPSAGQAQGAERNAIGSDAYHQCARREGIRP